MTMTVLKPATVTLLKRRLYRCASWEECLPKMLASVLFAFIKQSVLTHEVDECGHLGLNMPTRWPEKIEHV
jgi:hypothetical protein